MKAAKVLYLKKTQSHFNEAMRLNGERDGIAHACAEIAAYFTLPPLPYCTSLSRPLRSLSYTFVDSVCVPTFTVVLRPSPS